MEAARRFMAQKRRNQVDKKISLRKKKRCSEAEIY